MYRDTVLNKVPMISLILVIEAAMKSTNSPIVPVLRQHDEPCQFYKTPDKGLISGEELSWFLRKGYIKSVLKGPLVTVRPEPGMFPVDTVQWAKPTVEYVITEKGKNTKKWY